MARGDCAPALPYSARSTFASPNASVSGQSEGCSASTGGVAS